MSVKKIHIYQLIAASVLDHGIDTMFGLMGDANLFMVNDFVREGGGTFVPTAIEGSAVLMALGYARVSNKVGVATVTHGPGLTNCITALTEGVLDRRPMVLLCGDTAATNTLSPQNIDQRELVKATGAGFEQLRAPETAAEDIAKAFYRARKEKRPIVLNMPVDFMWQEVCARTMVHTVFEAPTHIPKGDSPDEAIGMIASARRPIILAGAGAVDARDRLIRLAEGIEAPLATTLQAKDLFDGHPANMGIFGTLSTPAAYDVIAKADCIIAFGSSLHFFTTDKGALMKGKRVVQITTDPMDIGKSFQPDVALVADPGLTADNIAYWLNEAEIAPSGFSKELDPETLTKHPGGQADHASEGYIDYAYALDRLEQELPKERIIATDGGRFMTEVWCRISVPDPGSLIYSVSFGAVGQGLQKAIGAAHGAPERPVVLFTGDGGYMMGGLCEFNTAVRTNTDLIVIVCNDAAYGAELIQFLDRQMDPGLSMFDWPSFAETATALGGHGVTVRSTNDLEMAIKAISERSKPILIDLRLDPNNMPRMRM